MSLMPRIYARFTQYYPGLSSVYEPLLNNFHDILIRENKFNRTPFIFLNGNTTFIETARSVEYHLRYCLKPYKMVVFAAEGEHLNHCRVEHENGGWIHLYKPAPRTVVMTRTWLDATTDTNRVVVMLDQLPNMHNDYMVAVNNSSFVPTYDHMTTIDRMSQTTPRHNTVNIKQLLQ